MRLLAEAMEDRILHSADVAPLGLLGPVAFDAVVQPLTQAAPAASTVQRSEIVFVDMTLPDARSLVADLEAQRGAGRPIEIVGIGPGQDGLGLIGAVLAERHDVAAVHVLAHGSDGRLQLGSAALDEGTLLQRAAEVAGWSAALTADADLLLYGCNLAQTPLGQRLVVDLASLTGADVASSTDLTGAAERGANWTLEYRSGRIETALAPSVWEQMHWQGVMATYSVTTTLDVVGGLLPGSLRWAIGQANANAGTDTITFAVNGTFSMLPLVSGDDTNQSGDFDVKDSVNIVGNGSANTIINGNGADRVFDLRSGTINISGLTVQGGRSNEGAGIRVAKSPTVTLSNVTVRDNVGNGSTRGAGIYTDGALTLRNVIVRDNGNAVSGNADGAGIYVDKHALLDARDVEIRDNVAAANKDGGGIYVAHQGQLALENVTLAGNRAERGGGLWNDGDGTSLVNVTLSGNTASSEGGGLWTDAAVTLDHVTVADNSSTPGDGGGVYDDDGGNVKVKNSLFAANTGGNTNLGLISQGYNLSDDASAGFAGTGDRKNVPAGLLALSANGGYTRTHAIGAGSAARDAANPVTTLSADQRGTAYVGGRADMGAYEYNLSGSAPTIGAVSDQSIAEDGTLAPIAFSIGDLETPAASLVVTAISSNQALVPDAGLVLGGSGGMRTIGLTPAANANSSANGGPTTITVSVSDGGNTTTMTFDVAVLAVNDAPVVFLPPAATTSEDTPLVLSGAGAPRVGDSDAGAAPLQLTLTVAHGLLTLSGTAGLSFVAGTGSADASMSFSGSQAAINAALDGLRYAPRADFNGNDRLDLTLNDLGNTGSGGSKSTSASLDLVVTVVNDAPQLGVPGPQVTALSTPLTFSAASGNSIGVADVDAGAAPIQLTLSTAGMGNGSLSFGSVTGLTLIAGTGSNDTTVALRGSQSDLAAALETLSFNPGTNGAARIDITLMDLGNSGSGSPLSTSGAVTISVSNDAAPAITLSRTGVSYTENAAAITLDPALTLDDIDNVSLASASVRIGAGYAGAEDVLSFTAVPATMGNISGTYSAGLLNLVSAGQTATLAQWQAALRSVTYVDTSDAPSASVRTVFLTINDGIADSAARSLTIAVGPVNDAPVLTGANDLAPIAEDATADGGTLVAALVAGHRGDADGAALSGIAVTGVDDSHGSWQYSTDGGNTWAAFGAASDTSARLLSADAGSAVRFVADADWNGRVAAGLTFRAWDDSAGSAGGVADASVNGGSSPFSASRASSGITVTPVNDAPVLAGANDLAPIIEDESTGGGTLVSALVAGHQSDVDAAALSGIAVTGVDTANGTWQYSTDGGGTWSEFGAVRESSALLLAADAFSAVRFVPNADWNGSVAPGLTYRAWDRSSGTAGESADASLNGGTTAFSASRAGSGISVSAANDAPSLDDPIVDRAATQGTPFSFAIPAASFGDIDAGDVLSYSARLSSNAPLPAWLAFDPATRTFSGLPGNADVGAVAIRVLATDSANASTFGDFTLTVADVNDAPVLARAPADQVVAVSATVQFALPRATFTDPDAGDTLTYAATLADGSALPKWLAFDAATVTFSGTPATADAGNVVVRVRAVDTGGAAAQAVFAFTVIDLTPTPTPTPTPVGALPSVAVAAAPVTPAPPVAVAPAAETPAEARTAASKAEVSRVFVAPATSAAAALPAEAQAAAATPAAESAPRYGVEDVPSASARAAAQTDAILANALLPQFNAMTMSPLLQLLHSDEMAHKFEELQRQMVQLGEERQTAIASGVALTGGLSIGYVVWLVRGGVLVSSMLSALPAWQMIDPLPVLAASRDGKRRRTDLHPDDPEVERLFDDKAEMRPGPPAASPVPAGGPNGEHATTRIRR